MKLFIVNNIKQMTTESLVNAVLIVLLCTGCEKMVEVEAPFTSLTSDNVYSNDGTAIAVVTGNYATMSSGGFTTGSNSLSLLLGLSSDELTLANTQDAQKSRFYINSLSALTDDIPWRELYRYILTVNTAIEKLVNSNSLTPSIKQQLIEEAEFLRAFYYFYLVNLYNDVPLVLSPDYRVTSTQSRTPKEQVLQQIISDLKKAQSFLSETFLDATLLKLSPDRIRPTKWAATALLARTYLYKGDWANAEAEAKKIIDNNSLFELSTITNTFLNSSIGNKEAIWQLQPVNSGWNTEDARVFILNDAPGITYPVYLDTLLVNSFESGDARRINWISDTTIGGNKYSYAFKYKIATSNASVDEFLMVLRLGEQYLIRAEARAQQNKLSEAISDLDKIRQRAGLPLIAVTNPGISQTALLDAIYHERQVELFTEWGHRWFDLKRTGKLDAVMNVVTPLKGGTWSSDRSLFPIPTSDIIINPTLTQNSGY